MILIGLAFLLFAALVHFASMSVVLAAVVTGVVAIVVGLVKGERL